MRLRYEMYTVLDSPRASANVQVISQLSRVSFTISKKLLIKNVYPLPSVKVNNQRSLLAHDIEATQNLGINALWLNAQ